jgi:hypothetical protein
MKSEWLHHSEKLKSIWCHKLNRTRNMNKGFSLGLDDSQLITLEIVKQVCPHKV